MDGFVNACATFTRLYSNWSGFLDRLGSRRLGQWCGRVGARAVHALFRLMQTGLVQNYLLGHGGRRLCALPPSI